MYKISHKQKCKLNFHFAIIRITVAMLVTLATFVITLHVLLDLYCIVAIAPIAHICTFEVVGYTWATITAAAFAFTSQEFQYLKKEIPSGNVNSSYERH